MTQLLSIPAAAARLACSRAHVYRLLSAGALRAVEIKATGTRSKTRVREEDLEAYIEGRTRSAPKGGDGGEVRRIDGT